MRQPRHIRCDWLHLTSPLMRLGPASVHVLCHLNAYAAPTKLRLAPLICTRGYTDSGIGINAKKGVHYRRPLLNRWRRWEGLLSGNGQGVGVAHPLTDKLALVHRRPILIFQRGLEAGPQG